MTDEVIELTKKLISIPSPFEKEQEIVEYISKYLGFCDDLELQDIGNNRNNIIARSIARKDAPTIVINGHVDTVKPVMGWCGKEYEPVIRGNRLYGLGSADQKAGVAIALSVFRKLYRKLNVNLTLLLAVDEENISKGAFCSINKVRNADMFLITEPSGEGIGIAARGRVVVKLEVLGKSAHGARPSLGINAIDEATKIVNEIGKIKLRKDPFMKSGSVCILKIESGVDSLSVPEYCTMFIDRHMIKRESEQDILAEFKDAVKKAHLKAKVNLSIAKRETPYLKPFRTDTKNQMVMRFLESYRKSYRKSPKLYCNESVGDYNVFGQYSPTLIYGPKGNNWHAKNEYVLIDSIQRCNDLYLAFLSKFNNS